MDYEYEFQDCVDLLFNFTPNMLKDRGLMHGIILDAVTEQLDDIIVKCEGIIKEEGGYYG